MKTLFAATAIAALTATTALSAPAGYSALGFNAPHHEKEITGSIMYPAGDGGRNFTYAENPVFHGVTVSEEAPILEGKHPIILLSHGMGGNVRSLAWLASGLAERGAIVVSVNHPNTTWGDFDLSKGVKHWTRVQDLTLALDEILADPLFKNNIDLDRVMAAGFSYGGWTALSLGGVTGSHQGYVDHCTEYTAESSACESLMSKEVQLGTVSSAAWDKSYADRRVTHVTAIDPGLAWGLNEMNVSALVANIRLIGFGAGEDRLLATDFDKSGFAKLLPNAQIDRIIPSVHFTGMPICKPVGAAILAEEKDDPVCTDPADTDRAAVHALIIDKMASDLGL